MGEPAPDTGLTRQALVLTTLGTPVMSAICVCIPVLILRLKGTSVPDTGFWIGCGVFGGFSLLGLGIVLRASSRVRRTREGGLGAAIARWAPALMVLGGVAGFFIGGRIADNAVQMRTQSHEADCALMVGQDEIAACVPVMAHCDRQTRDGPGLATDRFGALPVAWPAGLKVPDSPTARARVLCAWHALKGDAR